MASEIQTLHCLCSAFCAAIPTPLDTLPKRQQDGARICSTSTWDALADKHSAVFVNTQAESKAVVLKLEDGFEMRYRVRCGRCGLMVGYHLDKSQFEETKNGTGGGGGSDVPTAWRIDDYGANGGWEGAGLKAVSAARFHRRSWTPGMSPTSSTLFRHLAAAGSDFVAWTASQSCCLLRNAIETYQLRVCQLAKSHAFIFGLPRLPQPTSSRLACSTWYPTKF